MEEAQKLVTGLTWHDFEQGVYVPSSLLKAVAKRLGVSDLQPSAMPEPLCPIMVEFPPVVVERHVRVRTAEGVEVVIPMTEVVENPRAEYREPPGIWVVEGQVTVLRLVPERPVPRVREERLAFAFFLALRHDVKSERWTPVPLNDDGETVRLFHWRDTPVNLSDADIAELMHRIAEFRQLPPGLAK